MLNLAWGGFANGSAALAAVCVQAEGGIPGDLLEATTARAWSGWRSAVHARTGVWLQLDHSDIIAPGFRDVPNQQAAWDRYQRQGRPVASHPPDATHQGSNHGWGRALDCTGFENRPDVWQAMNDLAPQFGLSNATGRASGERWHWECILPPTTVASSTATPIIERTDDDEMISPETQTFLNTAFANLAADIKLALRREERGRLYYCATPPAGLPQYVCIFWDRDPADGKNILYANDGETQARNWNEVYYQTADTVEQAKAAAVRPDLFQKLVDFALGKDSSFTDSIAAG